jgi:hypothetical protein
MMREPLLRSIQLKRRKKIDPIVRLIEALLDFVLIAGFLSAIEFLMSITSRVVF